MANNKTKSEIINKDRIKMEIDYNFGYFNFWDLWDCDDNDGGDCYYAEYDIYEYLPDEVKVDYLYKRCGWRCYSKGSSVMGRRIDMSSIYSTEVLRQKRINYILGIDSIEDSVITIGDMVKDNLGKLI